MFYRETNHLTSILISDFFTMCKYLRSHVLSEIHFAKVVAILEVVRDEGREVELCQDCGGETLGIKPLPQRGRGGRK